MLTGMMHFRSGDSRGRRCARTRAVRTGRVDVRVVLWALQVCRKRVVMSCGRTRVWKKLFMGSLMCPPVQGVGGVEEGDGGGIGSGWRSSRFGRRGLVGGDMILLLKGALADVMAEMKCFWNATPDAPSPRA